MRLQSALLPVVGLALMGGCSMFDSDSRKDDGRDRQRTRVEPAPKRGDTYDIDRYRDRYGDDRYGSERVGERLDNLTADGRQLIRIGSVRSSGKDDQNDLIELKGEQRLRGLMFRVDRGAVDVEHIRVTFADDSAIEPKVSSTIRAGEETRLIELPGGEKVVKRVRLKYRGSDERASVIDVYGLPAD